MKVRVRLFAILKDAAGESEVVLDIPENCTGKQLLEELGKQFPRMQGTIEKSALAVNENYITPDANIPVGAEIAIIPPVSGG